MRTAKKFYLILTNYHPFLEIVKSHKNASLIFFIILAKWQKTIQSFNFFVILLLLLLLLIFMTTTVWAITETSIYLKNWPLSQIIIILINLVKFGLFWLQRRSITKFLGWKTSLCNCFAELRVCVWILDSWSCIRRTCCS